MESSKPALSVLEGEASASQRIAGVDAEAPSPLKPLTAAEQIVWDYITIALRDYGLIHRTDAMLMHMVVSTFVQWIDAEAELEKFKGENGGSYMTETPNGYRQPDQSYYISRTLKKELLQILPEACLTIPSFAKVKQAMRGPQQGDMFDDPLVAFLSSKPAAPRLVHSK